MRFRFAPTFLALVLALAAGLALAGDSFPGFLPFSRGGGGLSIGAADGRYVNESGDDMTGPLGLAAGTTCASPGLRFADDTDTGLFLQDVGAAPGHAIGLCVDGTKAGLLSVGAAATTSSYGNTFFGWQAGRNVDLSGTGGTGDAGAYHNTGIGAENLPNLTTGIKNTCIGNRACYSATTNIQNTCTGQGACYYASSNNNVGIGYHALLNTTSGVNTAIGSYALEGGTAGGTTGTHNVAIGPYAAQVITEGNFNMAIGSWTGNALTTGDDNVLFGAATADLLTIGDDNVVVGSQAARHITTQNANTVIGSYAAAALTDAENVFLGAYSADIATTATENVIVGTMAGRTLTTGDRNVIIGDGADVSAAARSDCIAIGRGAICTADGLVVLGGAAQTAIATQASDVLLGTDAAIRTTDSTGNGMSIYSGANSSGDIGVTIGTSASATNGLDALNVAFDVDGTPDVGLRVTQDGGFIHTEVAPSGTTVPAIAASGDDDSGWGFASGCPAVIDEANAYLEVCSTMATFGVDVTMNQDLLGFGTTGVGPGRYWQLPTHINNAPTKPTCDATTEGAIGYFDDSNDALAGMPCTCIADAARTGFTWLSFYGSTCPGA